MVMSSMDLLLTTYSSIKSKHMSWVRHVASKEDNGNAYRVLVRKPEGKRQCPEELGLGRRTRIKLILKK
jgi:hypothetical protein